MSEQTLDHAAVVAQLNALLEHELSGVVRYTHYSFMVFGYSRIPINSWLDSAATESLAHAKAIGEMITTLGEHPSLGIGELLESQQHDIGDILREGLAFEMDAVKGYEKLLALVEGKNVMLEEFARQQISNETLHASEIEKMLRQPGTIKPVTRLA